MIITIILALFISSFFIYLLSKVDLKIGSVVLSILILGILYFFARLYPQVVNDLNIKYGSLFQLFGFQFFSFTLAMYKWYFVIIGLVAVALASIFSIRGNTDIKYGASFNFFLTYIVISIIGVFLAANFITLYIFWELMTWTSFFMVSMGKKNAKKAALIYLFLSMIAAYFMLSGIFMIEKGLKSEKSYLWAMIYFVIAAFLKGGIYPLHVWLRPTHGNAPNIFSSILSGFLIKYGSYILFIVFLLFPTANILKHYKFFNNMPAFNYILALLGGISIIAGTIAAIMQEDVKYLIAFSSVSHAGYILLGLAYGGTFATAGGLMHIMVHMLTALGMFLSIAAVYSVTHTTKMSEMGGLVKKMPITFLTYLISIISVAGIPPMAGFISKWLIYQQLISKGDVILGFAAFFGSIGSFMYVFRPLATIFLGQLPNKYKDVKEVSIWMQIPMYILMGATVFFGVLPHYVLKVIAQIQKYVGIKPIKTTMTEIYTSLTTMSPATINLIFAGGFIIAFILYFLHTRTTKVEQWENYTAGEIVPELQTTPEIYHYAKNYYRPFERMFKKVPSLENWFYSLIFNIKRFFEYVKEILFESTTTVLIWISMLSVLIVVIIYFIKLF